MTTQRQPKKSQEEVIMSLHRYFRYVNYLSAAQLYLKENFLLETELKPEHIKERILGHWGTVPGLNFIYTHLNYLIWKEKCEMLFIAGPGHGAPAVIANLFAEGTLADFYPELTRDKQGTEKLIKMFSWPGGFPSHSNPGTPGAILEGGELGYSLATAYGAVLDNPDLIAACVIGDGEAETGPLAAAWHSNKFLNPKESGAVLPILHLNGYKITSPTIFGSMDNEEIRKYFEGLGYDPLFVAVSNQQSVVSGQKEEASKKNILFPLTRGEGGLLETNYEEKNQKSTLPGSLSTHEQMISTLEAAYQKIRSIQKSARSSQKPAHKPAWPIIVFRSPKGWTGIKELHQKKVEGSYRSHGIPAQNPHHDTSEFEAIKAWLESYKIQELIDREGKPLPDITDYIPERNLRMGHNRHTLGGNVRKDLKLPELRMYAVDSDQETLSGSTTVAADYIRDILKLHDAEANFRFFCPDETESNKLQALFETTSRAFTWPLQSYDENIGPAGRVMEVLSEHTLQGWLQGYLLTGRHGMFATYEAFAMIIASMVDQYAKFLKQSSRIPWRKPVSSLNYLLTSVGWRQEHNGYSHQNPSFISNILEKHGPFSSVYFPCDINSMLVILEDCFKRTNAINVIVANKNPMRQWLTIEQAREELRKGLGRWDWIDPTGSENPDIVLCGAGDIMVQECVAAIELLKQHAPEIKLRFVNISELTALGIGDERLPLAMDNDAFYHYFTKDKPIVFNFHGYPGTIKQLVWGHESANRFSIHGYQEEGTTTTPFDMLVKNKTSRYDLIIDIVFRLLDQNTIERKKGLQLINFFEQKLKEHATYIVEWGKDMPEVE